MATGWARARLRRMGRGAHAVLMWGLLWYALLNLVPLVLLCRSTEYPWHGGTAFEARKWPKLRRIAAEDADHPLVLMLGSSLACWALRAGALDGMPDSNGRPLRVYNFSIPATGPIHELLCLRDLLAEGIRPRFLLIELTPELLCEPPCRGLNEPVGDWGWRIALPIPWPAEPGSPIDAARPAKCQSCLPTSGQQNE